MGYPLYSYTTFRDWIQRRLRVDRPTLEIIRQIAASSSIDNELVEYGSYRDGICKPRKESAPMNAPTSLRVIACLPDCLLDAWPCIIFSPGRCFPDPAAPCSAPAAV